MQENTFKTTEDIVKRAECIVNASGKGLEVADCLLTENFLIIEARQQIRIPVAQLQKCQYGPQRMTLPDELVTFMESEDAQQFGGKLGYLSTLTVEYFDNTVLRTLSVEMDLTDAVGFDYAIWSAISKVKVQLWKSLPIEKRCAGFWQRFVAFFIDGIILSIIFVIILVTIAFQGLETTVSFFTYFEGLVGAIPTAYFVGFWAWRGQTPGKMLLGIKIVTGDGGSINLGRAILHYFGYFVSAIILFFGFFMITWDSKKQGLHDKIAGTYVIKLL